MDKSKNSTLRANTIIALQHIMRRPRIIIAKPRTITIAGAIDRGKAFDSSPRAQRQGAWTQHYCAFAF